MLQSFYKCKVILIITIGTLTQTQQHTSTKQKHRVWETHSPQSVARKQKPAVCIQRYQVPLRSPTFSAYVNSNKVVLSPAGSYLGQ